jgi:hypothetical protein
MNCNACDESHALVKSFSNWAKAGMPIINKENYENRLNICKNCEHYKMLICNKCGCIMITKARMGTSSCPIGKWKSLTPPPSV